MLWGIFGVSCLGVFSHVTPPCLALVFASISVGLLRNSSNDSPGLTLSWGSVPATVLAAIMKVTFRIYNEKVAVGEPCLGPLTPLSVGKPKANKLSLVTVSFAIFPP